MSVGVSLAKLPAFIQSISGEVEPEYWKPQSIEEWTEVQKITVYLNVWTQQQQQERSLRKMIGIWVFVLITFQILGVFTLVCLDAFSLVSMSITIVKFLIPSVLGEVFGMGFVVVKYLFNLKNTPPLEITKQ